MEQSKSPKSIAYSSITPSIQDWASPTQSSNQRLSKPTLVNPQATYTKISSLSSIPNNRNI